MEGIESVQKCSGPTNCRLESSASFDTYIVVQKKLDGLASNVSAPASSTTTVKETFQLALRSEKKITPLHIYVVQ